MIPNSNSLVLWDIAIGADGDLSVGEDGDFVLSINEDCLLDNIYWRLRTAIGDWVLEPKCGASLESYVGLPNTREVGESIRESVDYALSHDGFLPLDSYQVDVVPLSSDTVGIYLFVSYQFGSFRVLFRFDLTTGAFEEIRLD